MTAKKKTVTKKKSSKRGKGVGPCGAVNDEMGCQPATGDCPDTVQALCEQMREYMRCMCIWGVGIAKEVEVLRARVDKCCGGGGPGGVPKPPPPPF